jgi:hypothetical protein
MYGFIRNNGIDRSHWFWDIQVYQELMSLIYFDELFLTYNL